MAGTIVADTIKSDLSTPTVFNNSSGVEIGRLCRSWCNFNGSTGSAVIRASFNVSSAVRNGGGDYTVNISNAINDANYSAVANYSFTNTATGPANDGQAICWGLTVSLVRVFVSDGAGGARDPVYCSTNLVR